MGFPPFAMARFGELVSDMRNADTIDQLKQCATQWEEYARSLEQDARQNRAEYDLAMNYINELKRLYSTVIFDVYDKYGAKYPLPTSGFVGWLGARVTRFEFFESPIDRVLPVEQRVYKSVFRKSSTRGIYFDMTLQNFPPRESVSCPISVTWFHFDQDRNVWSSEMNYQMKADTTSFRFGDGCGYEVQGRWAEGKYAVNVYFRDEFAAQGVFEIAG